MIFHRARLKKTDANIPIILNNTNLEQVTFTKFLGVIIDDKLTFDRHIVYTKNKISKGLGIIIKARKYLNRESLLKLYNCFVFPYLTYCVEVWGNTAENIWTLLLKYKRKLCVLSPFLHTDPIFRDLNILLFSKLVAQRIGVLMFKYSIHVLPNSIEDLFTGIYNISINCYNTRNKSKLRQPRGKYEYMYRNFNYRGVYIWNKL